MIGKVGDLEKQLAELGTKNELLLEAYANAKKEKKVIYLDGSLAYRSYVEAHIGMVGDWSGDYAQTNTQLLCIVEVSIP